MPNWCDTTYVCEGDEKEIKALKKVLDANNRRKTSRVENDFGTMWIGNIIDQLGYNWEEYSCRGEITGYDLDDDILFIYQSTAWCEQEGFREVIQKKFPSIHVFFQAQEPSRGLYVTNDSTGEYFPEKYVLDGMDVWEFFGSIDGAAEFVKDIVGHDVPAEYSAIKDALEAYVEAHGKDDDDLFYNFYEFTVEE